MKDCSEAPSGPRDVSFRSLDGTALEGTLEKKAPDRGALFVHGIQADRDEFGLYSDMAARAGFTSLRFDLRAHGKSGGGQKDLTMAGCLNDIDAAYRRLTSAMPAGAKTAVVAGSFGGGLAAHWEAAYMRGHAGVELRGCAANPSGYRKAYGGPHAMVLLCPLLDYGTRWLLDKDYWDEDGRITDGAARELRANGLDHYGFRFGEAMFNEICWLNPYLARPWAPTLVLHGDADEKVPHGTAEEWAFDNGAQFETVKGAGHGFEGFEDEVIEKTLGWIEEQFIRASRSKLS